MLAGLLLGIVHDRRLLREAQVNLAIRWFAGHGLHERLPDHSSLTRIRQRWGAERFRRIFERTVQSCVAAGTAKGEVVHIDASLIRADVSWESLAVRHVGAVSEANGDAPEDAGTDLQVRHPKKTGRFRKVCVTNPDAGMAPAGATGASNPATSSMPWSRISAGSLSRWRSRPERRTRAITFSKGSMQLRRAWGHRSMWQLQMRAMPMPRCSAGWKRARSMPSSRPRPNRSKAGFRSAGSGSMRAKIS